MKHSFPFISAIMPIILMVHITKAIGIEWEHSYNVSSSDSMSFNNNTLSCDHGYIMAGLYTNRNSTIDAINCVTPSYPSFISQTCYGFNVNTSSIRCNSGFFVSGIRITANAIDHVNCCKYNESQLLYVTQGNTHDMDCFDDGIRDQWCKVDAMEYITGWQRTRNDTHLDQITVAKLLWIIDHVKTFGLRTTSDYFASSYTAHTLTLWFNFVIYQCIVVPITPSATYSCDSSTFTIIDAEPDCHETNNSMSETALLIENESGVDDTSFSNSFIQTANNIHYGIESVCISEFANIGKWFRQKWEIEDSNECGDGYSNFEAFCVDAEYDDCAPQRQLIYFDTDKPNVDILNAKWTDGFGVKKTISCNGGILTSNLVQSFGVKTGGSTSDEPHTLTLWFDFTIYECVITPDSDYTLYLCDSSLYTIIGTVDCGERVDKMLIQNSHTDSASFNNMVVQTTQNYYAIDGFCIRDGSTNGPWFSTYETSSTECESADYTHYDAICIDNQNHDCAPERQVVYFDSNRTNIAITNALWRDGTDIDIAESISSCEPEPDIGRLIVYNADVTSTSRVTVTVWYKRFMYQCWIYPESSHTMYGCDASTFTITSYCTSQSNQTKILIESTSSDPVAFSQIWIEAKNGTTYEINGICIQNTSASSTECGDGYSHLDTVSIAAEPSRQMIYFDTNQSHANISNALWSDATNLSLSCTQNPSDIVFGARVSDNPTSATVTLTLWFNFWIYECNIDPDTEDTDYLCDSSTYTMLSNDACASNETATSEAKLLVENDASGSVGFPNMFIVSDGTYYGINSICASDFDAVFLGEDYDKYLKTDSKECGDAYTHYENICLDYQEEDCMPAKQLVYFDLNRPHVDISNALWKDGTNVDTNEQLCDVASDIEAFGVTVARYKGREKMAFDSGTNDAVRLRLWFQFKIYECVILPNIDNATYSCDASMFTIIKTSDCDSTYSETKILIEASAPVDYVFFSNIFIRTIDDIWYGIDRMCISDDYPLSTTYSHWKANDTNDTDECDPGYSQYLYVCIDLYWCVPSKQLLYFDTSRPNVNITNASWSDGSDVEIVTDKECRNDALEEIEVFGVEVDGGISGVGEIITLTVWFEYAMYQCVISAAPSREDRLYSCNALTFTKLDISNCTDNTVEMKMLIDHTAITNYHLVDVQIKYAFINTTWNNMYGIASFCIATDSLSDDSWYHKKYTASPNCSNHGLRAETLCIDSFDWNNVCTPGQQVIYFDANRPNINITHALWMDGSNMSMYADYDTQCNQQTHCDRVDGGGWQLVRHAYNGWHPATDNLNGTDVYGVYSEDPQSVSTWSIPFSSDGFIQFLVSNGNCSEWMITTHDEFRTTSNTNPYLGHIIASHDSINYDASWYFRSERDEDPLLSFNDYQINNYHTLLYAEASYSDTNALQRFLIPNADLSVNVWIRNPVTTIVCNDTNPCNTDIVCQSGSQCNVFCYSNRYRFCNYKTIQCPSNANCSVYCLGPKWQSCLRTIINCPSGPYACSVYGNARHAASLVTVNGGNGTLTVISNNDGAFFHATINAGKGPFIIEALAANAFRKATINARNAFSLDTNEAEFVIDSDAATAGFDSATITCPSRNITCLLKNGVRGFEDGIINGGGGPCYIIPGTYGCDGTTISGTESYLNIDASAERALNGAKVICPGNASCVIACGGKDACSDIKILADEHIGSILNVTVAENSIQQLINSTIRCPRDSVYGNTNNCNIRIFGDAESLNGAQIYAQESFLDVNLVCEYTACFEEGEGYVTPKMFCIDGTTGCDMTAVHKYGPGALNYYNDQFACVNHTHICNSYRVPSFSPSDIPTVSPITVSPTISPIKYAPFESPLILYVDANGNDSGICNSSFTACQTIEHAYNVLHRMPMDGYGTISIGKGVFDLVDMYMTHSQVVLAGQGMNKTLIDCTNPILIECEWQCNLKMINITYVGGVNCSLSFDIFNGGNAIFEHVIFSNINEASFGIRQNAISQFIGCSFWDNQLLFDIAAAQTMFYATSFAHNWPIETANAMINIESSAVTFDDVTFEANQLFYSLIDNIGNEADVTIQSSMFRNNKNLFAIILSLNCSSLTTILNTIFHQNNECLNECIVAMNSDLLIDEYSLNPMEPSISPTRAPSQAPTTSDYYLDIRPLYNTRTTFTQSIIATKPNQTATFTVFIRSLDVECTDPTIDSFTFRGAGLNGNPDRYLDILDHNGSRIIRCGMYAPCWYDRAVCLKDYSLGIDSIKPGTFYSVSIFQPDTLTEAWGGCESSATVDAVLTVSCSDRSASSAPTMSSAPTPSPTLRPSSRLLHFVHNTDSSNNILYLYDFEPTNVQSKINFNGTAPASIVFEPCNRFDIVPNDIEYEFTTLLATTNSTNPLNQSGYDAGYNTLECSNSDICYVECGLFQCFSNLMILRNVTTELIECSETSSCHFSHIQFVSSNNASILCLAGSSCTEVLIETADVFNFVLECVDELSCEGVTVNITNTRNPSIICYHQNACRSIRIWSDTNDIRLDFYSFNHGVIVYVPSQYYLASDAQNKGRRNTLNCNPNDAYLLLDGSTYVSLNQSVTDLFGGLMPCDDVSFEFTNVTRARCRIQYEFEGYSDTMTHFNDMFDCFHPSAPIVLDDITNYICHGTDSPTADPTQDPTIDPTFDPSVQPTIAPSNAPSLPPTNAPSFAPTIKLCVAITFDVAHHVVQTLRLNYTLQILGCKTAELGNGVAFEFILDSSSLGIVDYSISVPIPNDGDCNDCIYNDVVSTLIPTNVQTNDQDHALSIQSNDAVNGNNIKVNTQLVSVSVCDVGVSLGINPSLFVPGQYLSINSTYSFKPPHCNATDIPYSFELIVSSLDLKINTIIKLENDQKCKMCNSAGTNCFDHCDSLLPIVSKNATVDIDNIAVHVESNSDALGFNIHVDTPNINISAKVCDVGLGADIDSLVTDCNECIFDEVKFKKGITPCYKCNNSEQQTPTTVCLGSYKMTIPYNHWATAYDPISGALSRLYDIQQKHEIFTASCPEQYCCSVVDGCGYLVKDKNGNLNINQRLCTENRNVSSPLCSECKNGTYELFGSAACGACDRTDGVLLFALIVLLLSFVVWATCIDAVPPDTNKYTSTEYSWKKMIIGDRVDRVKTLFFKIILYFYQGLLQILTSQQIFHRLLPVLGPFNLSFSSSSHRSADGVCLIPYLNALQEIAMNYALIAVVFALWAFIGLIIFLQRKRNDRILHKLMARVGKVSYASSFLRIFLIVSGSLIATCWKLMSCVDLEIYGRYVHIYSTSHDCFDGYFAMAVIVLLAIIVTYCYLFYLLYYKYDDELKRYDVNNECRPLVKSFRSSCYWFEFILFARRFLIASIMQFGVFLNTNSMTTILIAFLVIFGFIHASANPYLWSDLNIVEMVCLLALIVVLSASDNGQISSNDPLVALCIVLPLVIFVIYLIRLVVLMFYIRNQIVPTDNLQSIITSAQARIPKLYRQGTQQRSNDDNDPSRIDVDGGNTKKPVAVPVLTDGMETPMTDHDPQDIQMTKETRVLSFSGEVSDISSSELEFDSEKP
eukprot:256707_1